MAKEEKRWEGDDGGQAWPAWDNVSVASRRDDEDLFWTITEYHRSLTKAEKALVLPGTGNLPLNENEERGCTPRNELCESLDAGDSLKEQRSRPVLFSFPRSMSVMASSLSLI